MGSDPYKDARGVFETFILDDDGTVSFPVDPVYIANALGINVLQAHLDEEVAGMIVKKPFEDAEIYLNSAQAESRKRFTCAHEIGHFIQRSNAGELEFEFADFRDNRSSTGSDAEEVYANQFAAELLMPARYVRRMHENGDGVTQLAYRFGVSTDAMQNRMKTLRLL